MWGFVKFIDKKLRLNGMSGIKIEALIFFLNRIMRFVKRNIRKYLKREKPYDGNDGLLKKCFEARNI